MSKQRRILVIGDAGKARTLIRDSQGDRYRFTCCAEDNHSGTSIHQARPDFDWIVINGEALDGDKTDLIQSLRTMGFLSTTGLQSGSQRCGVEWLADGSLQLHCCAQSQLHASPATPSAPMPRDAAPSHFVFEYHAPVKRTG